MKKKYLLTDAERDVMEEMWTTDKSLTGNDILSRPQFEKWSSGYLHNVLRSMLKKKVIRVDGMVQSNTQYARTFVAAVTREEYTAQAAMAIGRIDQEAIKAALKKSKLIQEEPTDNDLKSGKYEKLMYADVQINDKCKRIHNYVSAKILYRNLMLSIIISVLVGALVRRHGYDLFHVTYMGWISCVAACIMGVRWFRFCLKCKEYILYCFLENNK